LRHSYTLPLVTRTLVLPLREKSDFFRGRLNWSTWSDPCSNIAELDPFRQTVVSIDSTASIVEIYLGLWHNSHFRQCCKQINAVRRQSCYANSAKSKMATSQLVQDFLAEMTTVSFCTGNATLAGLRTPGVLERITIE
jgi:hypothetical protein